MALETAWQVRWLADLRAAFNDWYVSGRLISSNALGTTAPAITELFVALVPRWLSGRIHDWRAATGVSLAFVWRTLVA